MVVPVAETTLLALRKPGPWTDIPGWIAAIVAVEGLVRENDVIDVEPSVVVAVKMMPG